VGVSNQSFGKPGLYLPGSSASERRRTGPRRR